MTDQTTGGSSPLDLGPLASSVHSAQARGLFRHPGAVASLLEGIAAALCRAVENNAGDPQAAWALRSQVYWDHFEMHIKEALLTSFVGLDPALCGAVQERIENTLADLKRSHRCC